MSDQHTASRGGNAPASGFHRLNRWLRGALVALAVAGVVLLGLAFLAVAWPLLLIWALLVIFRGGKR